MMMLLFHAFGCSDGSTGLRRKMPYRSQAAIGFVAGHGNNTGLLPEGITINGSQYRH
ncbi:MAG: hypothetical protein ACRC4H_08585 [Plesiomonas sp.]